MTNRLYKKEKNGDVREVITWRLRQARYFDPTFGGSILPGQLNVNLAQEEITPYTFLDGPRAYSPITSALTVNPYSFLGIDYRADWDPLHKKFLDHSVSVSARYSKYFFSVGETAITQSRLCFQPLIRFSLVSATGIAFAGALTLPPMSFTNPAESSDL